MAVQMGYDNAGSVDPRATKFTARFLQEGSSVHSMKPVTTNAANYPQHTILLSLALAPSVHEVRSRVDPPVSDRGNQTLVAVRPEEARSLARLLLRIADTGQDPETDPGHVS